MASGILGWGARLRQLFPITSPGRAEPEWGEPPPWSHYQAGAPDRCPCVLCSQGCVEPKVDADPVCRGSLPPLPWHPPARQQAGLGWGADSAGAQTHILAQPFTVHSAGLDAEIHEGRWVDPQLGGRVHATGGRWPHCEEGHSGPGRGRLTSQASLQPGGCTQPKRTLRLLGKTRRGGSLLWEDPGWGQPAGEGLRWGQPAGQDPGWGQPAGKAWAGCTPYFPRSGGRGFCSPGPPPWQSLERWSPAHLPLAPARLGPNGPPTPVPSPQLARLDTAPSTLVLTVPRPLPRCSAVTPLAPSPRPAARWKHRPDVGTVARGGGEEVAGGCPPGE